MLFVGAQVGGDGAMVHGWTARQLGWRKCGSAESMSTAAAATHRSIHADELACEDDLIYATIGTRYLTSLYWAMQVRLLHCAATNCAGHTVATSAAPHALRYQHLLLS